MVNIGAMNKEAIIRQLQLQPHPNEGGFFTRTYQSANAIRQADVERRLATAIYYLLTDDNPVGFMHRNRSDIVHCHHLGGAIRYILVDEHGNSEERILGSNILQGEQPQLVVKGGVWKIAELTEGGFGLITEVVSPGFDYADNEMATLHGIAAQYPGLHQQLAPYIAEVAL